MSSDRLLSIEEVSTGRQRPSVDVSDKAIQQQNQILDRTIKQETHRTRKILIVCVGCVSFLWIIFTAIIVLMLGYKYKGFYLSEAVMIAFLTTSLGTVLALLIIGLKFYFPPKDNSTSLDKSKPAC